VATILMIFLRINLPNVVQFKEYKGKSGPRILLSKAKFFTLFSQNFSSYPTIHCQSHWTTWAFIQMHCTARLQNFMLVTICTILWYDSI